MPLPLPAPSPPNGTELNYSCFSIRVHATRSGNDALCRQRTSKHPFASVNFNASVINSEARHLSLSLSVVCSGLVDVQQHGFCFRLDETSWLCAGSRRGLTFLSVSHLKNWN